MCYPELQSLVSPFLDNVFTDFFTGKKSPVKPIFNHINSGSEIFAIDSDNDATPKVALSREPLRETIFKNPSIDD